MKRNLAYFLVVMLVAVASCSFTNKSFENDDKDKLLLDLITYVLEKGHYEPKDIDDDFSVSVFEDFIDVIDPTKRYFIESDIAEFEQYKFQIDDQIKNTDITFFNVVYDRLMMRMNDAKSIYKEVLQTPFDYSENESINIKYDEEPFVADKEALKERWRKQLKYATLGTYDSKISHLEKDPKKLEQIRQSIGYNTYQSEKAIESGGFFGKGFLEGTRTKGDFVPEQHTDYIFSTVGEEWGFIGTASVIMLFSILFLRLISLAERQKNAFARMYGYGVISILLIHYFINIGMVIGVLPTIGIPLPFFSYGGSGLLFFTILLFVFLKLDTNRLKENY